MQLASAYYPILIDLARHKHCLTYGELVEKAKAMYPDREVVQNAIAVSTGRKLDVVRLFTAERELPDLTCLIIGKVTGECGDGFTRHFDPIAARNLVFSTDWSAISTDFDGYIKHRETEVTPRKKVKERKALEMMSVYFQTHRADFPATLRHQRPLIVELLMEGFTEEEAFLQALSNVSK